MEIRVRIPLLKRALQLLKGTVPGRTTLPILHTIHLEAGDDRLRLYATNLSEAIVTWIDAAVADPGACTVTFSALWEIVTNAPKDADLSLRTDEKLAHLTIDRRTFSVPVSDPDEYPAAPVVPDTPPITIPAGLLASLADVSYAAATDDTRPILTGVCLNADAHGVRSTAADGFRMTRRTLAALPGISDMHAIVPHDALARLADLAEGDVTLRISEHSDRIVAEVGETLRWASRLIDGKYPDVDKVIPTSAAVRIIIDRAALQAALKAVAFIAQSASNIVRLTVASSVTGDELRITSNSAERGQAGDVLTPESVAWSDAPSELTIACNLTFLTDSLAHTESAHVAIALQATAPIVITPVGWATEQGEQVTVVMPMSVR